MIQYGFTASKKNFPVDVFQAIKGNAVVHHLADHPEVISTFDAIRRELPPLQDPGILARDLVQGLEAGVIEVVPLC